MLSLTASTILLGLATLYFVLYRLQFRKSRPDEPPVVAAPGLPFLGHVLGMALQGGRYMQQLGLRLQLQRNTAAAASAGIYTLPVPGSRIYLVTDPTLAAAAQRATRTLSFTPIAPEVTRRILGFDDAAMKIVRGDNVAVASAPTPSPATGAMTVIDEHKYDESYGFMADMHDLIYNYMLPGDGLDRVVLDASAELVAHVNSYASSIEESSSSSSDVGVVVDLLAWMKHMVTVGAAQYFYGPRNPLAEDPSLEPAFWDFVRGLGRLLMVGERRPTTSRVAAILGGRPLEAREQLIAGFVRYLEAGADEQGSDYVQRRMAIAARYGWTTDGLARSELSFLFASIINTAIVSFWVVLRVFADPSLLQVVRAELGDTDGDDDDDDSHTLSAEHLRNGCPTLHAVFDETLRLGSNNMTTRLVLTDTVLADRYFLRAGSVLQISAGMVHADPAIWGENVGEFEPARFLQQQQKSKSASKQRHRAFGGGKTLCPGRHFATAEILALAAAVVLTFDMEDAAMGVPPHTPPRVPAHNDRVLPVHILEPAAKDVPQVRLRLRRRGRRAQVVA